jgi:hypothetical protein
MSGPVFDRFWEQYPSGRRGTDHQRPKVKRSYEKRAKKIDVNSKLAEHLPFMQANVEQNGTSKYLPAAVNWLKERTERGYQETPVGQLHDLYQVQNRDVKQPDEPRMSADAYFALQDQQQASFIQPDAMYETAT